MCMAQYRCRLSSVPDISYLTRVPTCTSIVAISSARPTSSADTSLSALLSRRATTSRNSRSATRWLSPSTRPARNVTTAFEARRVAVRKANSSAIPCLPTPLMEARLSTCGFLWPIRPWSRRHKVKGSHHFLVLCMCIDKQWQEYLRKCWS